jgi:hypothetical protein
MTDSPLLIGEAANRLVGTVMLVTIRSVHYGVNQSFGWHSAKEPDR